MCPVSFHLFILGDFAKIFFKTLNQYMRNASTFNVEASIFYDGGKNEIC